MDYVVLKYVRFCMNTNDLFARNVDFISLTKMNVNFTVYIYRLEDVDIEVIFYKKHVCDFGQRWKLRLWNTRKALIITGFCYQKWAWWEPAKIVSSGPFY